MKRLPSLRFSLRLFLLFIAVVAILLAIGGRRVYHARKQRQLITLIHSLGGEHHHDLNFKNGTERSMRLQNMDFSPTLPGPDWLRERLGDEYFVDVAEAFFDKGSHRILDDRGFAEFTGRIKAKRLPMPRGVVFALLPITDATLKELASFPEITSLHILNCRGVTDSGLDQIKTFKNLRCLDLKGCSITDEGLIHLSNMTELRELGLGGTTISDAGLKHLAKLKKLEWLALHGTQVTLDGFKRLNQILPNCEYAY